MTIKYRKMLMYLYKTFNGMDELSAGIKIIIHTISGAFILSFFTQMFLYIYPYIELQK